MRIEGILTKWNDDRGFGFIISTQGGPEVFVHVSAFPKEGGRPTIGERVTFEVEIDSAGKTRAKNLLCPSRTPVRLTSRTIPHPHSEKLSFLGRAVPIAVLVALAFYGYGKYTHHTAPQTVIATQETAILVKQTAVPAQPSNQIVSSSFHCDGRTYCSQMASCEEATFFLKNCPDVKMDGNNDGIPCEQQWCHP